MRWNLVAACRCSWPRLCSSYIVDAGLGLYKSASLSSHHPLFTHYPLLLAPIHSTKRALTTHTRTLSCVDRFTRVLLAPVHALPFIHTTQAAGLLRHVVDKHEFKVWCSMHKEKRSAAVGCDTVELLHFTTPHCTSLCCTALP
jgi:hypothetical protein